MTPLKVVFFCDWHDSNPYIEQLSQGLKTQGVETVLYDRSLFWFDKVIFKGDVDIVHFQTLHRFFVSRNKLYFWLKFLFFVMQILCLRILGIPTILTIHEWKDKLSGGQHSISNQKAQILLNVVSGLIVHCECTREEISQSIAFDSQLVRKIFVVPHGHYIDAYKNCIDSETAKHKLSLPKENTIFLIFGGIHPSKGVTEAIDAFIELGEPQAHLLIAGKSSKQMSELIHLKTKDYSSITTHVNADSYIPNDDIQLYMNASDIVVLPYKIFTTSGVALLAMSFARPCIAPKSGFFDEVFGENGAILYEANEKDGLLRAMKDALTSMNRLRNMGKYNFDSASRYNWTYIGEETRKVYDLFASGF